MDNIKKDLKQVGCNAVDSMKLKAFVHTAVGLRAPRKAENVDHQLLDIILSWKQTYIASY
jgi:hypothetical protein